MRRLRIVPALLAAALVALVGATAAPAARQPADVKVAACETALQEKERLARFEGRMRSKRGTSRMWMRFRLLERAGEAPFALVDTEGLGVWHKSRRRVSTYEYTQTVTGLRLGLDYQVLVDFRWYDADGELLARARRRSDACVQPLPNLRIGRVVAEPGPAKGTRIYTVELQNAGGAPAREAGVSLEVDGAVLDGASVDVIEGRETRRLEFTGPVCGGGIRATADPGAKVVESNELDNVRAAPCPRTRR